MRWNFYSDITRSVDLIHNYDYWKKFSPRERLKLVLLKSNDKKFEYEVGTDKNKEIRQDYPYLVKIDNLKT